MSMIMTDRGWQQLEVVCVNHNKLEGVYRPATIEEAQAETGERTDKLCTALQGWIDGDDFGTSNAQLRWPAMWRAAGISRPMFGAFGERL